MQLNIQVGEQFLLSIKRMGINGEGIGFYKRQIVFVDGLLPGEEAEVEVTKTQKKFAYAKVIKLKKKSPNRITPPCPYYEKCGGCQLQHLAYEEQLVQKRNLVEESFQRYFEKQPKHLTIFPTIGMQNPWNYRNKSQLPTRHDGDEVVVGMYERNTNRLVYIKECMVENKLINETRTKTLDHLTKSNINVFNPRFRNGSLTHLVIRAFEETKDIQVTAIAREEDRHLYGAMKQLKGIPSVNLSIQPDDKAIEIFGPTVSNISGKKQIDGKIHDLDFKISPEAFFQLNTSQMKVLYDVVLEYGNFKETDSVFDGYCGIGSIGMTIAKQVREVRGVDTNTQGIHDANTFAKLNGINNAIFYDGNILPFLTKWEKEGYRPDVVVMNPPRRGIELQVINYLQKSKIKKIIYVSCNPSTLAKNLNHLSTTYHIRKVQPVDMFPQTSAVETVVLLERK